MRINCPNCNQEYDVSEKDIGKVAECEKCAQTFLIDSTMLEAQLKNADSPVSVEKVVMAQVESSGIIPKEIKSDTSDVKEKNKKKTRLSKTGAKRKNSNKADRDTLEVIMQDISTCLTEINLDIKDLKSKHSKEITASNADSQPKDAGSILTWVTAVNAQIENIHADIREMKNDKKIEKMLVDIEAEMKKAKTTGFFDIFKNVTLLANVSKIPKIEESVNSLREEIKRDSSKDLSLEISRAIKDVSNKISNIEKIAADFKNRS